MEFAGPTSNRYKILETFVTPQSGEQDVSQDVEQVSLWDADIKPNLNKAYIGDPIRSFRTLIKRYEYFVAYCGEKNVTGDTTAIASGTQAALLFNFPMFPPPHGTAQGGLGTTGSSVGDLDWNINATTLMAYLKFAHLGFKGSARWAISRPESGGVGDTTSNRSWSTFRFFGDYGINFPIVNFPYWGFNYYQFGGDSLTMSQVLSALGVRNGIGGGQLFGGDDSMICYEVPFYNQLRFFLSNGYNWPVTSYPNSSPDGAIGIRSWWKNTSGSSLNVVNFRGDAYVAAGEDLSYVAWTGVPLMIERSSLVTLEVNGLPDSFIGI
jgi:hypothetical protein